MPFWDYLIGGCLRGDYASDAVEIASDVGSARVITDPAILKRVWANPLAREMLKRKGIEVQGSPGIPFIALVFFRSVGRGLLTLATSPLSVVAGIWAHFQLNKIHYTLADINTPKAGETDETVYGIMNKANSPQGQIATRAGSIASITKGPTNSLGSCYYDATAHTISVPPFIGKTIVKSNGNFCPTMSGKNFGAASALAIAFHEMGHAEQRSFLLVVQFLPIAILAAFVILCLITMIPMLPLAVVTSISILIGVVVLPILLASAVLAPIVQFFYERDASVRALANLLADGHITTKEAAVEATYALQLAASTYLMSTVIKVLQIFWHLFQPVRNSGEAEPESGSGFRKILS